MPLVKIFSRKALTVSAATLHPNLMRIWRVPAEVLKVLVLPAHDEASAFQNEQIYIDIRAKKKEERTQGVVDKAMRDTFDLLKDHGYVSNIRCELYDPGLQSSFFAREE